MTDDGILGEIGNELDEMAGDTDTDTGPDRDGVYDPADDVDSRPPVTVEWPEVEQTKHDLTAEEWGVYGEGPPALWDQFARKLNAGKIGEVRAKIKPDAPEWGESHLPMARSAQKPRGKHLFATVAVTPETMFRIQGHAGAADGWGTDDPEEFATTIEPKVEEYVERFEAGDRPGKFHAWVGTDGKVTGPQEGRHRAAAAMLAGLEWVPVVVLKDTEGTFSRHEKYGADRPMARTEYPEGTA